MFNIIKKSILENQFADKLRLKFRVDEYEYKKLQDDINALAVIWRSASVIDKKLMQVLYSLPSIVRYQAERLEYSLEVRERLKEIVIELDNLIMECLA